MYNEEILVFIFSLVIAVIAAILWYLPLLRTPARPASEFPRFLHAVLWPLCLLPLLVLLRTLAASDVRDDAAYLLMYETIGAAWIGVTGMTLSWFGLHPRDDVIERGNHAAAYAICGALLGVTLCYAGGNIGDGPGWWVVLFSAGLASAGLLIVWMLANALGHLAEHVTVERDRAAGLRAACLLVACGLILGRSVAGNWISAEATGFDLIRQGWPVLLLATVEGFLSGALRMTPERVQNPLRGAGVIPGAAYLAVSGIYVALLGKW